MGAASALTIRYVAPGGADGSNNCANSATPCATVQRAVDASDEGDEIRVAAGVYTDVNIRPRNDVTTTGVVTQVVYISKTVTIRGGYTAAFAGPPDPEVNPTTLDAQGQGRVLYIIGWGKSPTVEGLRLTDGYHPVSGGGIYVYGAGPTISHCRVYSNTAVFSSGGGIYLNRSIAALSHNVISHNSAQLGGGIMLSQSNAAVSNNVISHNNAGDSGGGLYLTNSSGATLSKNTIVHNTAQEGGGLSLIWHDGGTLDSNIIADNQASNGSGLYNYSSDALILHNTFARNTGGPGIYVDT